MLDVVSLGELLIDFVSTEKGVSLADSPGFAKKPGGAPANVAVGLARQGLRSGFVGKVGADAFGAFLRATLERHGVDCSRLATDAAARTTLAFVSLRPDGSPDFVFYRNPGADMRLCPDDVDAAYHRAARAFHFGSISLADPEPKAATLKALDVAADSGQLISYDPNYRPALWDAPEHARREILGGFDRADVAKVSEEEWQFVTGTADFEEGAKAILARGVRLLVVSCGADGCWFTTASASGRVPGYAVEVAETTGDGFVAALLTELLAEIETPADVDRLPAARVAEICDYANAVGALTATKVGAIPALPSRDDALRFWSERRRSAPPG